MPQKKERLLLHPISLTYFPDNLEAFIEELDQIGFIKSSSISKQPSGDYRFLTGEHFLNHVTFMGCSPYLKTEPDNNDDEDFCAVYLPYKTGNPVLLKNQQAHVQKYALPRCPQCKKQALDKVEMIDLKVTCQHCKAKLNLTDLDWKRQGGIVNFRIEITKIFTNEAIPTEHLLTRLHQITGQAWRYFYI